MLTHIHHHTLTESFFTKYPRHRTLISINKRNTGTKRCKHKQKCRCKHKQMGCLLPPHCSCMICYPQCVDCMNPLSLHCVDTVVCMSPSHSSVSTLQSAPPTHCLNTRCMSLLVCQQHACLHYCSLIELVIAVSLFHDLCLQEATIKSLTFAMIGTLLSVMMRPYK